MISATQRAVEATALFPGSSWEPGRSASTLPAVELTLALTPLGLANPIEIARGLAAHLPFKISDGGMLIPDFGSVRAPVLAPKTESQLSRLKIVEYKILVRWDTLQLHPRISVLSPGIDTNLKTRNPHVLGPEVQAGVSVPICVYAPHLNGWDAANGETWQLVLFISAWLATYQCWELTKRWLGPEASHDLQVILRRHRASQCWCGSGLPMMDCHGENVQRQIQRQADASRGLFRRNQ